MGSDYLWVKRCCNHSCYGMYSLCLTYNTTHKTHASLCFFLKKILCLIFCWSNTVTLPCIDVLVAPTLHWDLSAMTDYLQNLRARSEYLTKNQPHHFIELKAQSSELARLQLDPLSPEPRHDKVHSPIDIRRLNISQVIIKAISRIANLHHLQHQPCTCTPQAIKERYIYTNSPDPSGHKPATPSPSAQA